MKAALWAARFTLGSRSMALQVVQLMLTVRMFLRSGITLKVFLLALKAVVMVEAINLVAHRKQKLI